MLNIITGIFITLFSIAFGIAAKRSFSKDHDSLSALCVMAAVFGFGAGILITIGVIDVSMILRWVANKD